LLAKLQKIDLKIRQHEIKVFENSSLKEIFQEKETQFSGVDSKVKKTYEKKP
jgi:hypothetical protein